MNINIMTLLLYGVITASEFIPFYKQGPETEEEVVMHICKSEDRRELSEGFGSISKNNKHWAIILAGGNGDFMRNITRNWFGLERPEQFCCFSGNKTMLELAWKRAEKLVNRENIVTVTLDSYRPYLEEYPERIIPGSVLYQPQDCGTASAMMMALAKILACDSLASVVILPSDHFIHQEAKFSQFVQYALHQLENLRDKIILFGAEATWSNSDYSWIDTSPEDNHNRFFDNNSEELTNVREIHLNPSSTLAHRLYRRDALWNTSILTANAQQLWLLCKNRLPKLFERSEHVRQVMSHFDKYEGGKDYIKMAINHAYYHLQTSNIYVDLLKPDTESCMAMRLTNVDWIDWGRPERIVDTLRKYGLEPNFSMDECQ